jgi:hypothetical protein
MTVVYEVKYVPALKNTINDLAIPIYLSCPSSYNFWNPFSTKFLVSRTIGISMAFLEHFYLSRLKIAISATCFPWIGLLWLHCLWGSTTRQRIANFKTLFAPSWNQKVRTFASHLLSSQDIYAVGRTISSRDLSVMKTCVIVKTAKCWYITNSLSIYPLYL